jgi:exopolysaccharide biosynthesis polyprenyl glycosylphosphotransferase
MNGHGWYRAWGKRFLDVAAATVALVILSPLLFIVAALVRIKHGAPVLFRQARPGLHGRPFVIYKFRTMVFGADQSLHQAYIKAFIKGDEAIAARDGVPFKLNQDPRVTRVGRFLRETSLDELPQLLNVLKGEMSLVGPRPERPFFVSQLKEQIPYYDLRFTVKPGITGWAQISYGYGDDEADAVEKLQYDLYYTKYMSPMFDLQILFETIKVVLLGRGAQ